MNNLRQAAQAALEALLSIKRADITVQQCSVIGELEAALAEPQPEPVAWCPNLKYPDYKKQRVWANGAPKQTDIDYWAKYDGITLAYAVPQAQQPDCERRPFGDLRNAKWLDPECYSKGACQSLIFKQAQQPLTDDQIDAIEWSYPQPGEVDTCRANRRNARSIERAHGIGNANP